MKILLFLAICQINSSFASAFKDAFAFSNAVDHQTESVSKGDGISFSQVTGKGTKSFAHGTKGACAREKSSSKHKSFRDAYANNGHGDGFRDSHAQVS